VIVYFPAILLTAGVVAAYAGGGRVRMAGTVAMVSACAWALALIIAPGALVFGAGPIVATLLLWRPASRTASSFEVLTRRSTTLAICLLVALIGASRLTVGENPVLLTAVPWVLAAVGAAWFINPIDQREQSQGESLMIAGAGAALFAAAPSGWLTAGAAGAMALLPIAGERLRVPGRFRPAVSLVFVALALVIAVIAGTGQALSPVAVLDLSINDSGPILVASAVLLVAGAVVSLPGCEWAALLGILALASGAPSVQWAALGGLVAAAGGPDRRSTRLAWIAVAMLALTSLLIPLGSQSWSPRLDAVLLAAALVVILLASRAGMLRALVLPTSAFAVMVAIGGLTAANLTRFQWVAAAGAVLLLGRAIVDRVASPPDGTVIFRDALIAGLLLLAISARDSLGLGELAAALLVLDLAVVRLAQVPSAATTGFLKRFITLARSNWPPAVTFAGAALAVTAALQASLPLGLLAAVIFAAVELAPLVDRHSVASPSERPLSRLAWVGPALSIACGVAPALVLRMLRV
jgi:hypothetical protein